MTIEDRFWVNVPIRGDGCWIWHGSRIPHKGYGRFYCHGKTISAHRFSYQIHKGPIPDGLCVCHVCDTPECVNPDHLWVGTHKENQQDCTRKGRRAYGERNGKYTRPDRTPRGESSGRSKLTETDIRKIRELGGTMSQQKIADIFNTPQTNISLILRGKAWKHVT